MNIQNSFWILSKLWNDHKSTINLSLYTKKYKIIQYCFKAMIRRQLTVKIAFLETKGLIPNTNTVRKENFDSWFLCSDHYICSVVCYHTHTQTHTQQRERERGIRQVGRQTDRGEVNGWLFFSCVFSYFLTYYPVPPTCAATVGLHPTFCLSWKHLGSFLSILLLCAYHASQL